MYVFRKVRGFFAPPKFRSYATALSGALNMLIVLPFIANSILLLSYYVLNQNQTPPFCLTFEILFDTISRQFEGVKHRTKATG